MIAIPNIEKPKRCIEEWDFGLLDNPCKFLETDMSCILQPESEPFDCGENYEHCPLIDIVTCGECKHYGFKETDRGGFPCCTNIIGATPYRMPSDFCSYGERRADETQP